MRQIKLDLGFLFDQRTTSFTPWSPTHLLNDKLGSKIKKQLISKVSSAIKANSNKLGTLTCEDIKSDHETSIGLLLGRVIVAEAFEIDLSDMDHNYKKIFGNLMGEIHITTKEKAELIRNKFFNPFKPTTTKVNEHIYLSAELERKLLGVIKTSDFIDTQLKLLCARVLKEVDLQMFTSKVPEEKLGLSL